MVKLRECKGICHTFKGYKKGMHGYATRGGRCCRTCEYQTDKISDGRCRCCGTNYRVRPLKGLVIMVKRI